MTRETFFNTQITKSEARKEIKKVANTSKKFGISQTYYDRGQKYAKMIGVN